MQERSSSLIIAIDGHSSCGKSTVAKDLAKKLNYIYIDTGAMYRSVTLYALKNNLIDASGNINEQKLRSTMQNINITFDFDVNNKQNITFLNGENVEGKIRGLEVSQNVSNISTLSFVRTHLVDLQQKMGKKGGIVMDGRDIGTVVFPNADLKIFMTASPEIRAKRRFDELIAKGETVNYNEILNNVKNRDHIDSTRDISPLQQANDALVLDNSNLTKEEQLNWIINQLIKKQLI
ncbi:MAG: (d)CMP kinase [Marinilabiliaceae bacterium]|nr:(d)CMP kinase [Marinilabiliaceae bacterium]